MKSLKTIKTFKEYLIEADYKRFLKNNRNLTQDQKKEINDYFSKENRQAGAKIGFDIGWQSKKIKDMTYDDFMDIKIEYKSGRKGKKFKLTNIRSLEEGIDRDYFYIKTSSKTHECFIPLNFEASVEIASKKYGNVRGKWCVADKDDNGSFWKNYTEDDEVFVYVITHDDKWSVHIEKNRKNFSVWDSSNNYYSNSSSPFINSEVIPGFSIKDELLKGKFKNIYKKASDTIQGSYKEDEQMILINEERENLVNDIVNLAEGVISSYDEYEKNMTEYLKDIVEFWEAKQEDNLDDNYNDEIYEEVFFDLQQIKDDGIPLDEDMHDEFMNATDEFNLKEFGLSCIIYWVDVYDKNSDGIAVNDYGSEYDNYFNYITENYHSNIFEFISDVSEFISTAHQEPKSRIWEKRKTKFHIQEVYQLLEDNDMY